MQNSVEITVNWLASDTRITVENLPAFFKEHGSKSGLYFWIHNAEKQPRIAYIGEAAVFKDRFSQHRKLSLHGLYTAVDCGDGDLFDFYDCHTKYYSCHKEQLFACSKGLARCPYHKPGLDKEFSDRDERKTYMLRAVDITHNFLKEITFIFAEVTCRNDNRRAVEIRKEIEGLLMLQMLKRVAKNDSETRKRLCTRKRSFFWGSISSYPQVLTEYRITSHTPPADVLQAELGWE